MSRWMPDRWRRLGAWAPWRGAGAPVRTLFLTESTGGATCWDYGAQACEPGTGPSTEPGEAPQPWADFEGWCAAHAGQRARLVLAGPLTGQRVAPEALPLPDAAAVRAWAQHQFEHYHGPAARQWALAAWHDGAQRGACALHGLALADLVAAAARHGVRLLAAHPWWAIALQAVARQEPPLCDLDDAQLWLVEGCHVTCVSLRHGAVADVAVRWLDEARPGPMARLLQATPPPAGQAAVVLGYGMAPDPATDGPAVASDLAASLPAARWVHLAAAA